MRVAFKPRPRPGTHRDFDERFGFGIFLSLGVLRSRRNGGNFLLLGSAITFLFVAPAVVRDKYSISKFITPRSSLGHTFVHWNVAFLSAILLAFVE